ncbi:MAG: glycosyltransferase family 2 protein [Deltaproteobacteria bacterium]|nr:glycosyltransferase family 2 protein [Deltaproteobacteria bacterium]
MNTARTSISIIVPAFNEESNVGAAVETARDAASRWFDDVEIIVVNDGSSDRTGVVIDELAHRLPGVRAVHHASPSGLGGAFRTGLQLASMNYVMRANGCNDMTESSLDIIFGAAEGSGIVIPFTVNTRERSAFRRVISRMFTFIMSALFGYRLRYFNHSVLMPTHLAREAVDGSSSYAFQAAMLVRLLDRGTPFVEVGALDRFDPRKRTKAFRWANLVGVIRDIARLYVRERLHRRLRGDGVWGASRLAT